MTSFDPPFWIRHLGFYSFLRKSGKNENQYKIEPECLRNVQVTKFLEFDEENWKIQNYAKNVDFWHLQEICGCHGHVKNDGHTIDISKISAKDE